MKNTKDGKVTGLGGIFFKVENPEATRNWYSEKLGFVTNEYGSLFEFYDDYGKANYAQWSPFSNDTKYFEPSTKDFMINFRVDNLEVLHNRFLENGVRILDTIETYEYGKFLHILDNENNKIELWEPVDNVFTKLYSGNTTDNRWITQIEFESENPESLKSWYSYNLGIGFDNDSSVLPFHKSGNGNPILNFNLVILPAGSGIFPNSNKQVIISYSFPSGDPLFLEFTKTNQQTANEKYYPDADGNFFRITEVK